MFFEHDARTGWERIVHGMKGTLDGSQKLMFKKSQAGLVPDVELGKA